MEAPLKFPEVELRRRFPPGPQAVSLLGFGSVQANRGHAERLEQAA